MLTSELVDELLAPLGEDSPSGEDLEYDPDFLAVEVAMQGKPEQQFGDTIIPAEEPDWRSVLDQTTQLLRRTKDIRIALAATRSAMAVQGVEGLHQGLRLIAGFVDGYWDSVYPELDADDDNDPTMRLNALAALADEATFLADLYQLQLGSAPGIGPLRVRDVLVARKALNPVGDKALSEAETEGSLEQILAQSPEIREHLAPLPGIVDSLNENITRHGNAANALDLSRLQSIIRHLAEAIGPEPAAQEEPESLPAEASGTDDTPGPSAAAPPASGARSGPIRNRKDAVAMLNQVIRYMRKAEPGNPAPLLIERAKQLIGVSFLEIMENLAPDALDAVQRVTGRHSENSDDNDRSDSDDD